MYPLPRMSQIRRGGLRPLTLRVSENVWGLLAEACTNAECVVVELQATVHFSFQRDRATKMLAHINSESHTWRNRLCDDDSHAREGEVNNHTMLRLLRLFPFEMEKGADGDIVPGCGATIFASKVVLFDQRGNDVFRNHDEMGLLWAHTDAPWRNV